ncbi:MAG: hypothetical protein OSB05_07460 [Akkermansiaceae bacterium]|nr:hypothetical protein [Akkermansiaceae bacterium]
MQTEACPNSHEINDTSGLPDGFESFLGIEEFCNEGLEWFREWIEIPNGFPRAQILSNIFVLIEPDQFNRYLIKHLGTISLPLADQVIDSFESAPIQDPESRTRSLRSHRDDQRGDRTYYQLTPNGMGKRSKDGFDHWRKQFEK